MPDRHDLDDQAMSDDRLRAGGRLAPHRPAGRRPQGPRRPHSCRRRRRRSAKPPRRPTGRVTRVQPQLRTRLRRDGVRPLLDEIEARLAAPAADPLGQGPARCRSPRPEQGGKRIRESPDGAAQKRDRPAIVRHARHRSRPHGRPRRKENADRDLMGRVGSTPCRTLRSSGPRVRTFARARPRGRIEARRGRPHGPARGERHPRKAAASSSPPTDESR